jgi:hypothetical protein
MVFETVKRLENPLLIQSLVIEIRVDFKGIFTEGPSAASFKITRHKLHVEISRKVIIAFLLRKTPFVLKVCCWFIIR